ncbi:ABC transporter ATP-binding protein [Streptomyces sulfonofaciens]|uniref:ABC transporter ATP-binding protein n=1 Tax=Streptomyces sulfonofaciens TaxID=68272 RepID=A0A919L6H9_9ACTN|nr:ATP-binding cassette domain-containing protein [Streptomyces sulfonofaciens]GHH85738.1 ABC transporter ATP-binding protein [Streptomyces sulfonofaciens]
MPGRGLRFLADRRRAVLVLAAWSLLESAQTFLTGYCLARALDAGFLAGRTTIGLAWLAVAAAAAFTAAPVVRGVFTQLAELVEPLRDALVHRAVSAALHRALADPAGVDLKAVSRLTQQTELVRDGFAGLVLTARSFVFHSVGTVAGLLTLAPVLLVPVLPPLLLGLSLLLAALRPMARAQRVFLDADEALADRASGVAAGLRDVTACGAGDEVGARTGAAIDAARRASLHLARWAAVRTLTLGAAGQLPVVALLSLAPWLLRQGVTAGELAGAFTFLVQSLLPALHTLMAALGTAGSRLLVVLERFAREPVEPRPQPPAAGPPAAPAGRVPRARHGRTPPAVLADGVSMRYGPTALPVLDGLDLAVAQGEHLAVVGPSGIGKSTLTSVLAGLLAPDQGAVWLGGTPVAGRTARELARLRVLIPQEAYVFTGTVLDNLRLLDPAAPPDRLLRAAALLGAAPLLAALGGPDAVLDPAALSQGQRQLLALCRAYVSPAPLVILDEATCHLDPAAEASAESAFAARPGTLIVVAHRLSSARRADRVLVLDGPRTALGTHDDLLRRSAAYREMTGYWSAVRPGGGKGGA